MNWTAALIVSEKRMPLVAEKILPAVRACHPTQLLVVGDYLQGNGYTYLPVPPLTHSTTDALVKRDVAALACTTNWIAYFSDDHLPANDFGEQLDRLPLTKYDVFVPARYASQEGHEGERLNMGEPTYCGGHAGLFRRSLIQEMPWSAGPHDRLWDLLNSQRHQQAGARYHWEPADESQVKLRVFDVEPGASPWL